MGSGKTAIGKELSKRLGYEFADTDQLIEKREGRPISVIFKESGEAYFRQIEREVVQEVSKLQDIIIATGGGVIKDPVNVKALRKLGLLVWLQASPEIILKRVMTEKGTRPLLDVDEPLKEIIKLLQERRTMYEQADIRIDTNYITPMDAAEKISTQLGAESEKVHVDLGDRSYDIQIGYGLLDTLGPRIKAFRPTKVAIVSNQTIFPLYGEKLLEGLRRNGIEPEVILLPDGEEHKDLLWIYHIHGRLLKAKFDRDSMLIAFGGGVVGDMTGFVAATYMRGIRFIQVPTTLLSQVDSSVGGKTGVNHPIGKNMIGAFYQPSLVLIDADTLKTLPEREFRAGMAEVIKYGVIEDRVFFEFLKLNRDSIQELGPEILDLIRRSCEIKAHVVSMDEREGGLRAILNYGHTIGHAIEAVTGYTQFLHGEALAIGMCGAAEIAVQMGVLEPTEGMMIKGLVAYYGLPVMLPHGINTGELLSAMEVDKKASAGRIKFILPRVTGEVFIEPDADRALISKVLDALISPF